MSFVSDTIPNLVNGISQQPSSQRLASQGEEQQNCYSSIVEGLMKRSPTHHVAKLMDGVVNNAFLHLINRDTSERYVVAVTTGQIKVFDLAGAEKTVVVAADALPYLGASSPSTTYKALTVADYTFLLNTSKVARTKPYGISFTVTFDRFAVGEVATIDLSNGVVVETFGAELISNGGFPTDLTSWTNASDDFAGGPYWNAGALVIQPSYRIVFIPGPVQLWSTGRERQNITGLTPGSTYRLTFARTGGDSDCGVTLGSTSGGTDLLNAGVPVTNATYTYDVVATTTMLSLTFAMAKVGGGTAYIDNVSIKQLGHTGAKEVVIVGGDTSNTIAQQFVDDTFWYDPAAYTVTQSAGVITIVRDSPNGNTPFYLDASLSGSDNAPTIVSTPPKNLTPLVYVKQGNYGTNYTVSIFTTLNTADFTFTHLTTNTVVTNIATDFIATTLKAGLEALANFNTTYTITQSGSLLKFSRADSASTAFSVKCEDGNGDRNMVAIQGAIQNFADLPAKCFDGTIVKVTGDGAQEDDYFVKFDLNDQGSTGANNVAGAGTWKEWRQEGETFEFDPATMPHVLVRQSDGSFTFNTGNWETRAAGDQTSNPNPSFVGRTIEDILFFRNRLGFLADDNAILSESGEYFNFWRNSVQVLLDGDPIDVSAATTKVSLLRFGVPGAEKMLLFSDQQQLLLTGGDLLTPKTASIKPTTAFETTGLCRPIGAGKAIYFTTPRGSYTGLREYGPDKNTNTDDAPDVSAHVPAFIPANVFKMSAATNENLLTLLTRDDQAAIYVYKFYYLAEDKLQSSWSRWSFPVGTKVLNADFINTSLYLLLQREDGVYLEVLGVDADRRDTNMEFEILLDRRVAALNCSPTYNATENITTWALPYSSDSAVQMVVLAPGVGSYKSGQRLTVATTGTAVTIAGDLRTVPAIFGVPYRAEYVLSEIQVKTAAASGNEKSLTGARLQVRTVTLVYDSSGYFRVEVTPLYRDTLTHVMTPKKLARYAIGTLALDNGEFRFPVSSKSDQVEIRIVNDSPYPFHIMSASWEGELILRSKRM